jgi:hypothetical protein
MASAILLLVVLFAHVPSAVPQPQPDRNLPRDAAWEASELERARRIVDAKIDTLVATEQGVMFGNGRVWFRPLAEHKNAVKIVAINDPNRTH